MKEIFDFKQLIEETNGTQKKNSFFPPLRKKRIKRDKKYRTDSTMPTVLKILIKIVKELKTVAFMLISLCAKGAFFAAGQIKASRKIRFFSAISVSMLAVILVVCFVSTTGLSLSVSENCNNITIPEDTTMDSLLLSALITNSSSPSQIDSTHNRASTLKPDEPLYNQISVTF